MNLACPQRKYPRQTVAFVCMLCASVILSATTNFASAYDAETNPTIVVYGATPAGLAAAMTAADGGHDVVLVEPTLRIGGLTTNGLSHADFRSFPGITGLFQEFTQRVDRYYRQKYGDDSSQVRLAFRGTQGEPSVNLIIFSEMLAERPRLRVLPHHRLTDVKVAADASHQSANRIVSVTFQDVADPAGSLVAIAAEIYIDASYEGDLLAAAGVPYRFGREGRREYSESLAPAEADDQLQGYNFRLIMTTNPRNRVAPKAPPGYDRNQFLGLVPLIESGEIEKPFAFSRRCIIKAHIPGLPNDKYDMNDVSRGLVRKSLPGENRQWPDGDPKARQRIFNEHRLWNEGLVYFAQNDPDVPAAFRQEAQRWGWCQDEFPENDHLPLQLYVREARRMIGSYVFSQQDTAAAEGNDARAKFQRDAVAMGDYGLNCHGTGREGGRFGGRHTGEFYQAVAPYQIPYGVLTPDLSAPGGVTNLLVPGAVSSTHVGFCALRLEPIWSSLGQAAGAAAAIAATEGAAVQGVPVAKLQQRLHAAGAATLYISDVLSGDPDFPVTQWWGALGGFHGLHQPLQRYGERGKNLVGQYFEPFPNHAANLRDPLDSATGLRWLQLAKSMWPNIQTPEIAANTTRGQWLRRLHQRVAAAKNDR